MSFPFSGGPVRHAAAFAAGALTSCAFAPVALWPAAIIGVGFFLASVRGARLLVSAGCGAAFAVGLFAPHVWWAFVMGGVAPWVGLVGTQLPVYAMLGVALTLVWRYPLPVAVVGTPAVWVLAEGVKARWPFGGFGWARLAFASSESPYLPLAGVIGAAGVSATMAGTAALCVAIVVLLRARRPRRAAVAGVLGIVAPLAALVTSTPPPPVGAMSVAAVQGTTPGMGLGYFEPPGETLRRHAATHGDISQPVDLVVWPETGADIDPQRSDVAFDLVDQAVRETGAPALIGTVTKESGDIYNSVVSWDPQTGPGQVYHKRGIVPFGEYIPYRGFFERVAPLVRQVTTDFSAGTDAAVFTVGSARVAPIICFEISDDALVTTSVRAGATLLAVHVNTAQFGYSAESAQQIEMARVRAVEHGRAAVNVSTVGESALIGPRGEVITRSDIGERTVLTATLPLHDHVTFATTWGPRLEVAIAGVGLLFLIGSVVARSRRV